jgi:tetratricopeptide (TPR) repeat protein
MKGLFWVLSTIFFCSHVAAESMQVIGGSSYARECYRLSNAASLTGHAGGADVAVCTKAVRNGGLRKADLIATYVNRGILYVAMEDYKKAARDYNKAIKLSDNVAEAYVNRGNLWFMAKRYTEAINDYDKSLSAGLKQAHIALLNRGMAYESLGRLSEAQQSYLAALERVEDWSEATSRLARVNKKLSK